MREKENITEAVECSVGNEIMAAIKEDTEDNCNKVDEINTVRDEAKHRRRINRMKTIIITVVIILFTLPTLICIYLGTKVQNLQNKVEFLYIAIEEDNPESSGATKIIDGQAPEAIIGDIQEAQASALLNTHAGAIQGVQTEELKGASTASIKDINGDIVAETLPIGAQIEGLAGNPTEELTGATSGEPTGTANGGPTGTPNGGPTGTPSVGLAGTPSLGPTVTPNGEPTVAPGVGPTVTPEAQEVLLQGATGGGHEGIITEVLPKEDESEPHISSTGIYAGKKVYLSFDDGPSVYTDEILDILKEYGAKATFFVIGKTDKESKRLYKRIIEEGHTLGMHSYSHVYKQIYNSLEDFDKDFTKLWKLLYDTTGYMPTIYRFPGGSGNKVNKYGMNEFILYLKEKSIIYYDWNVDNGDATSVNYTKEQLTDNVLEGVKARKRSIVLMHDVQSKRTTVESLPMILEELVTKGAELLPLDENVAPIQQIRADKVK